MQFSEEWWKQNNKKFYVEKTSGTYLNVLGWIIHKLAKISALFPNFQKKHKPKQLFLRPELKKRLEEKRAKYREWNKKHQDADGFILHEHCDATLMSGLLSMFEDVNIPAALGEDGFWQRRTTCRPCYPNGSGSSFSRDMQLGLMWYLWMNKRLDLAEATFEQYKKHQFVMGVGDPARLLLMPTNEATLAEICYLLGGKNRWFSRRQMQVWAKNLTSYRVHLLMWHSLLRISLLGYATQDMVDAFKVYATKNPKNPLHQFAYHLIHDGNMNGLVETLLDDPRWPNDRLPRRKDRRNDWVISRDDNTDDQKPAVDGDLEHEHSGGDFLVLANLILHLLDKQ